MQHLAFAAVCLVFFLANSAFSATPILFSAYLDERHFAMSVAGSIATAESIGLAIGSTLSVRLIKGATIDLRSIAWYVLGAQLILQLLSAFFHAALPFGVVRLASGVCVGMVQSIGSAWISQFKNSERLFSIYIGMTFLSGTLGIPFFSFTLRHAGLGGSFVTFAGLIGLAMIIAIAYPRRLVASAPEAASQAPDEAAQGRGYALGLLLVAVVINFSFNGGIWTFLDQLGKRAGIDSARTSLILGAGMFTALGVTAVAGAIGNRIGRVGPLLFAHVCLIASSLGLLAPALLPYVCAVIVFHVGLAVISPFFLASLAAIKPSERSVLRGVAAMNVGFSIGPWLISVLVDSAGYSAILAASAALFASSLVLVLIALGGHRRSRRLRWRPEGQGQ